VVLSATAILGLVMTSAVVVGGVLSAAERSSASTQMVADPTAGISASRAAYRVPRIALPSAPPASEVTVTGATFVFHDDAADLYALPDDTTEVVVMVAPDAKVGTTGATRDGFTQVVYANRVGWVKSDSLVTGRALTSAACASGSGVEKGLQPDTIRVHRAVCTIFPQIKSFGGLGGGGEHASGQALDIMTKDLELGTAIAMMAQQHWRELGVSQVIWQQHIWTSQRAGDGWRPMGSRGSETANHKDHVHVTTYGNSGNL
jgi:hypothetical protein